MVKVNGKELNIGGKTLSEYLATTDYDPKRIAVERNGDIVFKSQYAGTVLKDGDSLELLTFDDEYGRWTFRHTASHILAQAVKRLFPQAKLAIGPAVDDGFYYDFDAKIKFTPDDLVKIESEMKKIVKEDLKLERFTKSREDAIKFFEDADEPYKVELIEDLPEDSEISFYDMGDLFTDLCKGPHVKNTKELGKFEIVKEEA